MRSGLCVFGRAVGRAAPRMRGHGASGRVRSRRSGTGRAIGRTVASQAVGCAVRRQRPALWQPPTMIVSGFVTDFGTKSTHDQEKAGHEDKIGPPDRPARSAAEFGPATGPQVGPSDRCAGSPPDRPAPVAVPRSVADSTPRSARTIGCGIGPAQSVAGSAHQIDCRIRPHDRHRRIARTIVLPRSATGDTAATGQAAPTERCEAHTDPAVSSV